MKPFSRRTHSIIRDGGRAAGILIAATLVGLLFSGLKIPEANIIAVYILGVLIISIITSSWMYSFLASVISVLAFNFLFTIPRFTLRAYDPSYPVTFGIMFLVALITGSLASRMKEYARESAQAAMQIEKEQLRADLLRSISHDLRTPLTSISGNASNLLSNENEFSQETRMQIYGDIYDDSMWLIKLVENLLSVTRIEDGRMDLRMSAELMDEVIAEAMRHTDRNRDGRKIEVSSDEEFILGKMDARLIVQVVINLVDNAVKYTPEGAQIRIHTGKRTVWWWCRSAIQVLEYRMNRNQKYLICFIQEQTGRRTDAGAWDWGWDCADPLSGRTGEKYGYQTISPRGLYLHLHCLQRR